MKYLQLYENLEPEYSLRDFLKQNDIGNNIEDLNCIDRNLTSLDGIENLTNLKILYCWRNKLTSLKGIENLTNLKRIDCAYNYFESIDEIECLNKLTDLLCQCNAIKNIEVVKNLDLSYFWAYNNNFEYPVSYAVAKKYFLQQIYNEKSHYTEYPIYNKIELFTSYEYQKEFIEEHPEKIIDLMPLGFDKKIKEEYGDLLDFFNIKL